MLDPLSGEQVDEIIAFLKSREVFNGRHVVQGDTDGFSTWEEAAGSNVLAWRLRDAILAPHILERALEMQNFAAQYLGVETPYLYSINIFVTRPGEAIRPDIQEFHRDMDDVRFLPMFFYLTDVGADGRQELRGPAGEVSIEGPRGTVFLSNTMLEHRGLKPQHGERIIAWARWCVTAPPPSYVWDKLEPIDAAELGDRYPSDPRLRESMRLLATTEPSSIAPPPTRIQARFNGKQLAARVQG